MYNGVIRGSCIEPYAGGSGRSRHLVVCGSEIQSRRDDTKSKASKFSLLHSLTLCRRANRWHVREKMLLVAHWFSSLARFEEQSNVFTCKNDKQAGFYQDSNHNSIWTPQIFVRIPVFRYRVVIFHVELESWEKMAHYGNTKALTALFTYLFSTELRSRTVSKPPPV